MKQMHTIVAKVLTLPLHAAAITSPRSAAMSRRPLTANSRSSTVASAQAHICPFSTSQHMAAATRILSASGSRNFPTVLT